MLGALVNHPERTSYYISGHSAEHQQLARKVQLISDGDLKQRIIGGFDQIGFDHEVLATEKFRSIKVADAARDAGMLDWYHSTYATLSFSTHSTVGDLTRFHYEQTNGEGALLLEPTTRDQDFVWAFGCELALTAAQVISGLFSLERGKLEVLLERLKHLSDA